MVKNRYRLQIPGTWTNDEKRLQLGGYDTKQDAENALGEYKVNMSTNGIDFAMSAIEKTICKQRIVSKEKKEEIIRTRQENAKDKTQTKIDNVKDESSHNPESRAREKSKLRANGSISKIGNKFKVRIPAQWTTEKKQKCIGSFDTREDAMSAIEKHRPSDFPEYCSYVMHNTQKNM